MHHSVKRHWRIVAAVILISSLLWGPPAYAHLRGPTSPLPVRNVNYGLYMHGPSDVQGLVTAPRMPLGAPLGSFLPKPEPVAVRQPTRLPESSGSSVWDRLAQCESGGNWHHTGGRFSGGLQFLPSTWRAAGGTRYAPTAAQATREQQIAIAQSWLARTSWSQWPACSRRLGLR